ncbi:MAG: WbqC family protein [Eggerthellaceae bacterium]
MANPGGAIDSSKLAHRSRTTPLGKSTAARKLIGTGARLPLRCRRLLLRGVSRSTPPSRAAATWEKFGKRRHLFRRGAWQDRRPHRRGEGPAHAPPPGRSASVTGTSWSRSRARVDPAQPRSERIDEDCRRTSPIISYHTDKMAKADEFVVLDEVQFTDGSPMSRNRFLQVDGEAKLLSLSVEKKGYLEKPTRDVRLSNWPKTRKKHRGFIECNYRKTPYFDEVMPLVAKVLEADCDTLLDLDMASIEMLRSAYGVETPLVLQSSLPYDTEAKNNDLVLGLCRACGADVYLSGRGARAYMDDRSFAEKGIAVRYQEFSYPEYPQ